MQKLKTETGIISSMPQDEKIKCPCCKESYDVRQFRSVMVVSAYYGPRMNLPDSHEVLYARICPNPDCGVLFHTKDSK